MEKLIYKNLLDNDKSTRGKNIENGHHRLPESPKRRAQYQTDLAEQLIHSNIITKSDNISNVPQSPIREDSILAFKEHEKHIP